MWSNAREINDVEINVLKRIKGAEVDRLGALFGSKPPKCSKMGQTPTLRHAKSLAPVSHMPEGGHGPDDLANAVSTLMRSCESVARS